MSGEKPSENPRLAWVTGASKGIGRAVAIELAARGWSVAASARDETGLHSLVEASSGLPGTIRAWPLDITQAESVRDTVAAIETEQGDIALALLNAGTHEPVDGREFSADALQRLVDINLMGTAYCLEPVIARFVARKRGRIAVVASLAGYRGLPSAGPYGATKAALINLCEALRVELAPSGVTVQIVTPGFVRTPLTDRNTFPMPFLVSAEEAARRIADGIESGRFEITFPRRFAAIMKTLRVLPYAVYFAVTSRMRSARR